MNAPIGDTVVITVQTEDGDFEVVAIPLESGLCVHAATNGSGNYTVSVMKSGLMVLCGLPDSAYAVRAGSAIAEVVDFTQPFDDVMKQWQKAAPAFLKCPYSRYLSFLNQPNYRFGDPERVLNQQAGGFIKPPLKLM